jgi:methyl-accepting chemotaxis protein
VSEPETVAAEIVTALVDQIRVTSDRLRRQSESLRDQARDLGLLRTLLQEIAGSMDSCGLEVSTIERVATVVAAASLSASTTAAEIEQGVDAWRRAVNRMMSSTQPVSVRRA